MRLGPEYNPLPASFCECGGGASYLDDGVLNCAKCGKARQPEFESPATRLAEAAEQADRRVSIWDNKNRSIQILAKRILALEAQLAEREAEGGESPRPLTTTEKAREVGCHPDTLKANAEAYGGRRIDTGNPKSHYRWPKGDE